MRPEVKICGLKKPADAQYVNDAGTDYAGFVFYEKSRRNLSRQQAEEIMKKIQFYLDHRSYEQILLGAVVFSNVYGLLGQTRDAEELIHKIQEQAVGVDDIS